ncbi:hypothetical protein [Parvibaculum sp.]|jgi:chemotaxis protein histidine kinase CheA|uniref:hypothetical protein n=1 Tax=Parvibaculum sp. TaxID=2024848 RepID=UPI003C7334D7
MKHSKIASRLAGHETDGGETPPEVRFVRVPSIAERKLGSEYVAPMRLDPRILDQMQATIRSLESKYVETLSAQVSMLQVLAEPACKGDREAHDRLYAIAHDVRGLAGTFGFAMTGRFADSLCRYLEQGGHGKHDSTVIRFHVDAIRDTLESPGTDVTISTETLDALEKLIAANRESMRAAG